MRREKVSSTFIRIWIGTVVVFFLCAVIALPSHKLTARNLIPSGVLNLALLVCMWTLSGRVREGQRIAAALSILVVYGVMVVIAATIVAGRYSYDAPVAITSCLVVSILAYTAALISTAAAAARREGTPREGDERRPPIETSA